MKLTFTHTRIACYLTFFNSAVSATLMGLLLTTLQSNYGLTLNEEGNLMAFYSTILIVLIPVATAISGKVGFRIATVSSQIFSLLGFLSLGILPNVTDNTFTAIMIAISFYALGLALAEANINCIIESLPSKRKDTELSLLHSVFSWAQLLVILITTGFFLLFSREKWFLLPVLFALVPFVNFFLFLRAPFQPPVEESERTPLKQIVTTGFFILILIIIFCDGAIELCMPQWASVFAENALGISKTTGDILGPGLFTLGMAISRIWYGFKGQNIKIEKAMFICAAGSALSYMFVVLATVPILSLLGCGILGLCVGILAPGTFTIASNRFPKGGVYVFGTISSFMYIGTALSTKLIGTVITSVENSQAAVLAGIIPATSGFDLGIRTSFLLVGVMAVIMAGVLAVLKK